MKGVTVERDVEELQRKVTLGTLRLQHEHTKEIILIPTPSKDPNDPLNWSKGFRYYIAITVCLAVFMCNFLAAGPTIAIEEVTIAFFGPPSPKFPAQIAKVAYFFTSTALLQGLSNLLWMPLIIKYGRRPVYLTSFTLYTATAIWAGVAKSYSSELAARILMGVAAGAGECIGPVTIADTFFLHERGLVMAIYTAFLSCGVSGGIIIAGLITIDNSWRYIYYVAVALIGGVTVLIFLTMPETAYTRNAEQMVESIQYPSKLPAAEELEEGKGSAQIHNHDERLYPKKHSYVDSLRLYTGVYTKESFMKLFFRPVALLCLPPVLWATLVMSVTIGFLVAISSNVAVAFQETYDFKPWQSGLCFIAGLIGSLLGIPAGGWFSDLVANYLTTRNGGIREPEMRLPAICIGLVASPLSLLLYGVGIQHKLHWICPTIGLGLLSFAISQATNVTLVYTIDSYRPVAGEVITTQLGFKAAFGFLLSFYTNPWIDESGYQNAFGAMAGISAAVLLFWIVFYVWGKRIRHATLKWPIMKGMIEWREDREVGE